MNMIIETPRLFFREFTADDAPLIYELNADPEVVKYVHEEPTTSHEMALAIITSRILPQYANYGHGRWAVHLKDSREFVGWCGLKYRPERAEVDLGYRFLRRSWGKGYATEAAKATLQHGFEVLALPGISAMAHIENLPSLRVLEKSGMHFRQFERVEGCLVRNFFLLNPSLRGKNPPIR